MTLNNPKFEWTSSDLSIIPKKQVTEQIPDDPDSRSDGVEDLAEAKKNAIIEELGKHVE